MFSDGTRGWPRVVDVTRSNPLQNAILFHNFEGMAVNLEAEAQPMSESGISEESWMLSPKARFAELATSGRIPSFGKVHMAAHRGETHRGEITLAQLGGATEVARFCR